MSSIEKWAERVYAETDFGKSIATSLSGMVGLIIYLRFGDWPIAAFASIIFFPIARITATTIHTRVSKDANRRARLNDAGHAFDSLSDEEKAVVNAFVNAGGCVLTWEQVNSSRISITGIESLIQRQVLFTSMTADGARETFVLDTAIFEVGSNHAKTSAGSQASH